MSQRKVPWGESAPNCPVYVDAEGVWHVVGYAAARSVLRSTQTRQGGFGVDEARGKTPKNMRLPVLWRDGPEHREDRRQTARFFTPRRVDEHYRGLMHDFADEQIARLRREKTIDLSRLAFALGVNVAGEVIGLTPGRPGMGRRLDRFFTEQRAAPGWRSPAAIYRMAYGNLALAAFYTADVAPAIRARRASPRDDLISHLLAQGCRNGDIFGECVTFAAAGMATIREFIVVAAWHLFTDDALRADFLAGDQARRSAILHEVLRLEPVIGNLFRWATGDIDLPSDDGPLTIPSGARVDVGVASANIDPTAVGADPVGLCPGRTLPDGMSGDGLAFGDGPHRCPGAHIAIQEADIFLTKLFAQPGLRMVEPPRSRIRVRLATYEVEGLMITVR